MCLDADYLAFSFHKMLAPFGVGVLYGKEHLLEASRPFLYGGDMIAEGRVFPERVEYNSLPWKYAAGTPNILGTIVSAQALRILLDLALVPETMAYFGTAKPLERSAIEKAMNRVGRWNRQLTARALDGLGAIPGLAIYGPRNASRRTSLVAFNVAGRDPVRLAESLNRVGVESRAGCHCATLAHHALKLNPPASCRLSFYLYNTLKRSTGPWLLWPPSPPAATGHPHPGTGASAGRPGPARPTRRSPPRHPQAFRRTPLWRTPRRTAGG
jgi:cysteine desulfurase/selenocysteine lyase